MSYTTIYRVNPGVSVEELQDLRNAWGSAPVVWGTITEKVLRRDRHEWSLGDQTVIWKQWENMRLPEFARAVLGMTFDRVYIERQHFGRAAADIRKFLEWAPQPSEHANHWPAIADLLDKLADDDSCSAIGFNHTSVSETLWRGDWDEEKEDYGPLDWSKFWSLYPELDAQTTEAAR